MVSFLSVVGAMRSRASSTEWLNNPPRAWLPTETPPLLLVCLLHTLGAPIRQEKDGLLLLHI